MAKINIPLDEILIISAINGCNISRIDDFSVMIHDSETIFDIEKELIKIDVETLEVTNLSKTRTYYWVASSSVEPAFYFMDNLKFLEKYVDV